MVSNTQRRWWQLDPGGVLLGFALAALSVTPSLLPRSAELQGALAGLAFGVGYAIGALLSSLLPWQPSRWFWPALAATTVLLSVGLSALALYWQNELRQIVQLPPLDSLNGGLFFAVFVGLSALLLLAGRAIRRLLAWARRRWRGWGVVAGLLAVLLIIGGVVGGAAIALDRIYFDLNGQPAASVSQPTSPLRSGSPESLVPWDTVGRHGSTFLARGPSAAEITAVINQPASEPIRVYAGLESAPSTQARAELVVAELKRTGAFDREVLVVATATGSGWLEPQTVDSIEYLHAGNTAIASMQYAYTPSWVSFLFDQQAAITAGTALFEAVHAAWAKLPVDHRPQLISYGLSLGALGAQGGFADLATLRDQTSGAMYVGTPYNATLWQGLTASRDAGSPIWQPVVDDGAQVRWYTRPETALSLPANWQRPRLLYLQHANDPVTWLSSQLIWHAPEWLTGPRAPSVSPAMFWIPGITAAQVVVDMFMGEQMPAGTGHNYGDVVLTGWAAVTGGVLDASSFERVQTLIEGYSALQPWSE